MYEIDSLRFHSVNQEVTMPGKTATLPDVDKTLKKRGLNSKPVPTPKTDFVKLRSRWVRFKRLYFERCYGTRRKVLDNQRRRELSNQSWELMNHSSLNLLNRRSPSRR